MENTKAKEAWERAWSSETHRTEYAQKRIASAKSAKLTPIRIDREDLFGYFQGDHGRYETFLDSCPCGDFIRNRLPCKHIYRLAMELGVMDKTGVKSDENAIATPKQERVTLDETIDIVESLSQGAQETLLTIAANIRSTTPTYLIRANKYIDELLTSKIVCKASDNVRRIDFAKIKKSDIIELLEDVNIQYDKKATKADLQKLCAERIPKKAMERFGVLLEVTIPTKFSPMKIHHYLSRKYGSCYLIPIDEAQESFLYYTDLPDDDVTGQLIKRGYYAR